MARKLRIAASVFFGLVAMALCVLWMRTQTAWDKITIRISDVRGVKISSISGTLSLEFQLQKGFVASGKPFRNVNIWRWQSGRAVGNWTSTSRFHYSTACG